MVPPSLLGGLKESMFYLSIAIFRGPGSVAPILVLGNIGSGLLAKNVRKRNKPINE